MGKRLRIGVLGAGHLGRIHLQQALEVPELEVVGIYDPHPEKRNAVAAEFSVTPFTDQSSLIAAAELVDVVTPTLAHHGCAREAIEQGRHVFIEKPVTNDLQEARDLALLAERHGVQVQVGHVERFNPAFQAARASIEAPMFIEVHRLAQWNPRGTDVSVVLDLMIHDLDIVLHVVGRPLEKVSASGVAVVSDSPDIANARLEFAGGCVANLTASRISLKNMRKSRFFQRDAYISVDMLDKKAEVVRMRPVEQADPFAITLDLGGGRGIREIAFDRPEVPAVNAIREELRSFAAAVANGTTPVVSLADGTAALDAAHRILEAMATAHASTLH